MGTNQTQISDEYVSGNKSGVGGGISDVYGEDSATLDQLVTPWVTSVARYHHKIFLGIFYSRIAKDFIITCKPRNVGSFYSCFCDNFLQKLYFFFYSGYTLMRDPRYNKGLAFTDKERDAHYITGLLPPVVLSQDVQVILMFMF